MSSAFYQTLLPFLDVEDGMSHVMNNKILYLKLLKKFDINALVSDLKSEDKDVSLRAAHSIKGASANLGMKKLSALAFAAETAAKENQNIDLLITQIETAAAHTLDAVAALEREINE